MSMSALRRVTELFIEGVECVLDEKEPVLVWVNKLNPFEVDEARRDGQAARTRFTLALEDPRSEESQLFDLNANKITDEVVTVAMTQAKKNEDMVNCSDDLRADEEWAEKINMLDRASEQLADRPQDDPELVLINRVTAEYFAELDRRTTDLSTQRQADYASLPHDELRAEYRKMWVEERATQAFLTEYRISELFYSLRECKSSGRDENGRWQHGLCDHRTKLMDDRTDVRLLPRGLVEAVRPILNNLAVDDRSAKDSVEGPKSSDSSQPPSEPEGSAASSPVATPPEQATTSTPPSGKR